MKAVELFAGTGGLAIGANQAGFECTLALEINNSACETLKLNQQSKSKHFNKTEIVCSDIRNFSFFELRDNPAIVTGGPPCQPFSLGGLNRSHSDERDLFPEAIRAIREMQPKCFLFENVKGLARESSLNYLEYIKLQLRHPELIKSSEFETWQEHVARLEKHETSGSTTGLSYNVITKVINAADYGVPQRRERIFIVGFRADLHIEWHFPEPTHSEEALLWEKWMSGNYWDKYKVPRSQRFIKDNEIAKILALEDRPEQKAWLTVRDAISGLPNPTLKIGRKIPHHDFIPGARVYSGHTGSLCDYPSKTLKAGVHGVPGGENMMVLPNGDVRYFTMRECARLQTFPDDILFYGSWSEIIKQIGNAVPCKLAKVILLSMRNALIRHYAN